jgi:hypothetical protein
MFTASNFEPSIVIHNVLNVIERHELGSVDLPRAARLFFRDTPGGSPIWIVERGNGVYVNGATPPCTVHLSAQKNSTRCIRIENCNVIVTKCTHHRMSDKEYNRLLNVNV